MDSKANLFKSVRPYFRGISLNKRKLKRWIYTFGFTLSYVANQLHMSRARFKSKLASQEPFNQRQITELVYLMGAYEAFNVLCFSSLEERNQIKEKVFCNSQSEI